MKNISKSRLQKQLKLKLLQLAAKTGTYHVLIGSCLSCFDILFQTLLYEMKPQDKFILSKGHAALSLYVILNHQKIISDQSLASYLKDNGQLGIHPPSSLPEDIPLATGSLGHGLSYACGLSKGYLLQKIKPRPKVYCLLSDGECNEGTVWEAALFASHHRLKNLIVMIDKNNFQAFGKTKEVLGEAASKEKWQAFGFNVFQCNGHSLDQLGRIFNKIEKTKNDHPNLIICDTLRGKGIKSVENKLKSNYIVVTKEIIDHYQYET